MRRKPEETPMCTAITLSAKSGEILLGRTMDFSYPLSPALHKIRAGTLWHSGQCAAHFRTKYAFCGIGQDLPPLTFADGINSEGFSAAVLYFAGYAAYDNKTDAKASVCLTSTEVVFFLLGMCKNVEEAVTAFETMRIVGVPDSVTGAVAPLHWILADCSGRCVVVEKTASGLHRYENNVGVLANSPDFSWHMTNLRNYINLIPTQTERAEWGNGVVLTQFGQGGGTSFLPGGFASPDRFVRAAWLKSHILEPKDSVDALRAGFHILGNVSLPKGCVVTERGSIDYTQYIVFYNLTSGEVSFRMYNDVTGRGI